MWASVKEISKLSIVLLRNIWSLTEVPASERVQSKWLKEGWVGGTIGDKGFGSEWGRKQTWEELASADDLC